MTTSQGQRWMIGVAPALFVFLWSTGYVGAKFGLPHADPMTFTSVRFAIVVVLLIVISLAVRAHWPRRPRTWLHLGVSGLLIHTGFIGATFTAIDLGVDIGIASLIAGIQPIITALFVSSQFGERVNARQWGGFVLGFAGLSLVVVKGFTAGSLTLVHFALCVIALLGITFGTIYQKRFVTDTSLWTGSTIQFAAALVPCVVLALLFEDGHMDWVVPSILAMAWLCIALSIGAISILTYLMRAGAAAQVSSLFYLVPPVTALQGYLLFDERLTILQLVGIVITAIGVALINRSTPSPNRIE